MTTYTEKRRDNALADLNRHAKALRRDIASLELKAEFYAADCSLGAEAYKATLAPLIAKNEAALRDVERLIEQIESRPVQLPLL